LDFPASFRALPLWTGKGVKLPVGIKINKLLLMIKIRAIIVEDEAASRETLRNYLGKYCPDVQVVAEAANVTEGLKAIRLHNPDLVFLDVEMPYGNAFDLLSQVENPGFETIFVTAFSNYAIQALNFSASYYILKPVDIDELIKAVEKVKLSLLEKKDSVHTQVLLENIQIENKQLRKIVLPLAEGFEVVRVNEVIRLEAEDNFTRFWLVGGKKMLICRTLKFYENLLGDFDFLRVHKSHMVNLQYIRQYLRGKGGQLVMEDGAVVEVSANRKQELMERFRQ
jgi:two-component system LytT family response regulator